MVVDLVALGLAELESLELAELESLERLGVSSWGQIIQSGSFCHEI